MIVTSSVAWRISSSLCDTSATARCSSTTTVRSTENSCSLSAGVSTLVGSSKTMISRLAPQALDDLDPLALAGGEPATRGQRVDAEAVALADRGDPLARLRRGRGATRSPSIDVLPHRQRLDEAVVLVDHGDAEVGGGQRVGDHRALAVDRDRPLVGLDQPDEDLHQRRLAGAVLAEHAVDAARLRASGRRRRTPRPRP